MQNTKRGKKKGEITLKRLFNVSFWAINLFVGEKMNLKKGLGKKMIKIHNIYHCGSFKNPNAGRGKNKQDP